MKKLFPAICMTLLAAALLGTSTFAWFSMNTQVSATGMQVTAKTDNTYLLISSDQTTASAIQGQTKTKVDLAIDETESKVYPCAPAVTDPEVGYLTTESGKKVDGEAITTAGVKVENATTAVAVTNWYTANAAAPNASTIQADTARQLTSFTGYVIQRTVYLTVAKGANPANNLTVTPTFEQKESGNDLTAARVLITTSDGGFAILKSEENNGEAVDIKGKNTNLTDTTVLTVTIYIYYDGNNDKVFTNNAVNLKGATVNLKFDVKAVTTGA